MAWEKYSEDASGTCSAVIDGAIFSMEYSLGVVTTGRQRVFKSHRITVMSPGVGPIHGDDHYNLRDALMALDKTLREQGIDLQAIGLSAMFTESGLSHNSGYGYVQGHPKAIHMMSNFHITM